MNHEAIQAMRDDGMRYREIADHLDLNQNTLRKNHNKWRKARDSAPPEPLPDAAAQGVTVAHDGLRTYHVAGAKTFDDLVRECAIDLSAVEVVKVDHNTWTTPMRDAGGHPCAVVNWKTAATLRPLPSWALREPIKPGVVIMPPMPSVGGLDRETVLIIPDMQVGHIRERDGTLTPMHDRAAISLALVSIAHVKPDVVVWLGDNLDAAEFSNYRTGMEHQGTFDASLHELHFIYERARLAHPAARHIVLEGNHDARINRVMQDNVRSAASIRCVGDDDDALSMRKLLGLDALGFEYHGPYGEAAGDAWLWTDRPCVTRFTHGTVVKQGGGATVAAVLKKVNHSQWQGHIHRSEMAQRTLWGPTGSATITAASPGCMCRSDGAVPSVNGREDWQQGLGTITRIGDTALHALHAIDGGMVLIGGDVLTPDRAEYEQALRSRWPGLGL